jgi:hypothetical protein
MLDDKFSASFIPYDHWTSHNYIWVSCGAVPSERSAALRAFVEAAAIPAFIRWAKEIEVLDDKSPRRREPQHFKFPFPEERE